MFLDQRGSHKSDPFDDESQEEVEFDNMKDRTYEVARELEDATGEWGWRFAVALVRDEDELATIVSAMHVRAAGKRLAKSILEKMGT